jgi:FdhD protein
VTARGRTQTLLTQRFRDGERRRGPDELIVEEPLSIQLDGVLVATTMRTPGDDFVLAAGYCHTEGLLGGAAVTGIRYCGTGSAAETFYNVVTVETGGQAPEPEPRLTATSSSCGLCGAENLDALMARLAPLPPTTPIDLERLVELPARARPHQELFAATGSVHAAAAFDADGELIELREDIGRHNAVDKVVGSLLLAGNLPATGLALFVSGRASVEMVAKAWSGGFGAVCSVSGPSALAVAAARRAGLQLVGFARDGGLNVYSPA